MPYSQEITQYYVYFMNIDINMQTAIHMANKNISHWVFEFPLKNSIFIRRDIVFYVCLTTIFSVAKNSIIIILMFIK